VEKGLDVQILLIGDNVQSSELFDHRRDGLFFVTNVIFGEFVDVLAVDIAGDGFNGNCINDSLECEFLPLRLLSFLKLEKLMVSGGVHDGGVDECWRGEAGAVKGRIARYKARCGFGEDEGQVAVPPHLEEEKWLTKPASFSMS